METPIYPEHNQSLVETNLPTLFFGRIYVNLGQINGAIATIPQYWALYPSSDHGTHGHKIIYYTYVLNIFGVMNTLVVSTCQSISKKCSLGTIIPFNCVTVCVCTYISIVYECTRYFETTNQSYQRFMSSNLQLIAAHSPFGQPI